MYFERSQTWDKTQVFWYGGTLKTRESTLDEEGTRETQDVSPDRKTYVEVLCYEETNDEQVFDPEIGPDGFYVKEENNRLWKKII